MSKVVFLDTGVLGFITHPAADRSRPCVEWLAGLIDSGVRVCFVEVCDYELRRKLLHIESADAIAKLDTLKDIIDFVPIGSPAMTRAAELRADARRRGQAAAADDALDGDVIQVAQALLSVAEQDEVVIATDNVGHLGNFVSAQRYEDIAADE